MRTEYSDKEKQIAFLWIAPITSIFNGECPVTTSPDCYNLPHPGLQLAPKVGQVITDFLAPFFLNIS